MNLLTSGVWDGNVVQQRSVSIKLNENVGPFQSKNGLGQGDPLSQIPFNIVGDMLIVLINKAKEDGQYVVASSII